jgi:hypothetical protein
MPNQVKYKPLPGLVPNFTLCHNRPFQTPLNGLLKLFAAIQTLKDWEEQQDDSSHKVVRQLKDTEKRAKAFADIPPAATYPR